MIEVGDTVKIKYHNIQGEVLAIENEKVTIEIERGRMSGIPIEALELIKPTNGKFRTTSSGS